MSLVPYNRNADMQQLDRLATEFCNVTGQDYDTVYAEISGASPDQLQAYKLFLANVKKVGAKGNDTVDVKWSFTVQVTHTDDTKTVAESFYVCPGLLATAGDNGVMKALGTTFTGLEGNAVLKVTSCTGPIGTFLRYIYDFPTYSSSVKITGASEKDITGGKFVVYKSDPSVALGKNGGEAILFMNYNVSASFQEKKAEISDVAILLSKTNIVETLVQPGSSLTLSFDFVSKVPSILAQTFLR